MNLLVDLQKVTKRFKSWEIETTALDHVNLQVKKGDFISVMGPSGCGKSTLLNILGLLDTPDSGQYLFSDIKVYPAAERERDKVLRDGIGFIFQKFNLIDDLSIFDNVMLPMLYKNSKLGDLRKHVNDILDSVGIGHRASHRPQQLSGGQQQRAAIARAIVSDPQMILADEPTGNLDSDNGIQIMEILTDLNKQGKTIIMVTHSKRDAAYAHKIIEMQDGRFNHPSSCPATSAG